MTPRLLAKNLFVVSWLVDLRTAFDTENDLRKVSPTRVLAKNVIFIFRLVDLENEV